MMSASQWLTEEAPKLQLTGLAEHTDEVESGFGFVCVAAEESSRQQYVEQAIERGAKAVLGEVAMDCGDLPHFEISQLSASRGQLAAEFYGKPSDSVRCIGITGTNGKTSVAFHIADLLNTLGHTAGYMGTLGWGLLDSLQDPNLTTGNAVALQRRLAKLRDAGCDVVAMEISSHALAQHRAHAVAMRVAIFTNLSRDHLDYHQTMAAYAEAKTKLLSDFPIELCILNADDEFCTSLKSAANCKVITFGHEGQWRWHRRGNVVVWQTPHGELAAELAVMADYAIANITVALIIAVEMGHTLTACQAQLPKLRTVPGRLDVIQSDRDQPKVAIDFAHTPDALQKVLEATREFCDGRLICVVGCGGDRDAGKRPQMGSIAGQLADAVWLTSDNPRSESPQQIIQDMLSGIDEPGDDVHVCVEREAAIRQAIASATSDDIVVIAGKGHENYQEVSGVKHPFSDHDVARHALRGN